MIIVILPLTLSLVVVVFGWVAVLGRSGLVNSILVASGLFDSPKTLLFNKTAVVVVLVQQTIPFMILSVMSVVTQIDPALEQAAVMELGRFAKQAREGSEMAASLTRRELQILELISTGLTMRQTATRLGISPRTVETHVAKLYRKLAVRTRVQAVARAASLGLIDLG